MAPEMSGFFNWLPLSKLKRSLLIQNYSQKWSWSKIIRRQSTSGAFFVHRLNNPRITLIKPYSHIVWRISYAHIIWPIWYGSILGLSSPISSKFPLNEVYINCIQLYDVFPHLWCWKPNEWVKLKSKMSFWKNCKWVKRTFRNEFDQVHSRI